MKNREYHTVRTLIFENLILKS